ncbi:endonuclease/exonuclease/phosphatase family protein [Oscillatoria sp. FACHB-1407]|uniref:endonuclease/exonuclease/phosphatase family protein n=1 Tax=Oscillatoria sp. FACHB-1407 TaxID=2692847 RepID=UPI00168837C8|nr:endonuclease/exonuclease/phosphatase family protein [Oscillatoria sp. FACHB-1407]MBD2463402.1 endonuclease/exonuclease/phosphatase family protein [Oscillatoria sp. FACHB-1407]
MKIATYNLRCGGKAGQRVHWTQIFEVANPDIFLVQETCHPQQYVNSRFWEVHSNQVQWAKVGNNAWGSAVFVRAGLVNKIEVPQFEGNVVGVEVEGFAWSPTRTKKLRVISIHAPAPYKPSVNRILDWLATLSDDADLIIGGDFNLTVGVRHSGEQQQDQDLWLLERLRKEFGLMSCWQAANPNRNLVQTLRWSRDKATPYHCDGIFVPAAWYRYLDKCEVLTSPMWEELSDHNPVIATFSTDTGEVLAHPPLTNFASTSTIDRSEKQ